MEQALQEIGRHEGVQRDAELGVVTQPGAPLEHDERADPLRRQRVNGLHEVVDDVARLLTARSQHSVEEPADLAQPAADLRLEEHEEDQHPERPEVRIVPARRKRRAAEQQEDE